MSNRKRETPEALIALYREVGFPPVDQILAGRIVARAATEVEEHGLFLLLNCARDFTCDDPAIWAEAEAALATLAALDREKAAGHIDATDHASRSRDVLGRCSLDTTLALFNLHRTALAADLHVRARGHSRNGTGRS